MKYGCCVTMVKNYRIHVHVPSVKQSRKKEVQVRTFVALALGHSESVD